jgi:hypothetical protein
MPFIRESIVTTLNPDGSAYIAPLGVIEEPPRLVLAPFQPSTTLDNLRRHPFATVSYTTDARIFAGCVTRRQREWPVVAAERIQGWRLAAALAHSEVEVEEVVEDEQRPRSRCRELHEAIHAPFRGLNRAQAACLEGAILVSRLHMLPAEKIDQEMAYLQIAIGKTAGEAEREAWNWLVEAVTAHQR